MGQLLRTRCRRKEEHLRQLHRAHHPLRYRGYYYDRETRLYYLQSRYYDFANYRFINADTFATTDANGYKLLGVFDVNPDLIGKEMCGVPILPLSDLDKFCAEHHPEVAVLCVPRQSAMDLSDELVRLGIQGFWNFSHYDLSVEYPGVTVENVHLGDSLMSLGYRLRNQE